MHPTAGRLIIRPVGLTSLHLPRRHNPEQIESLFSRQRTEDPLGIRIHFALALLACLMAGGPTTVTDLAALPVLICFLIRMTGWHGMLEPLVFDRVFRLLLAWGAWLGLSILWSAGRTGGSRAWLNDIQGLHFLTLALLLWPVLDRRTWLIAALMLGIICGQISQLVHLAGESLHIPAISFHRNPGRISGWWDPVVGGDVLCAGLGLWLAPALFGASRSWRIAGRIGVGATLACIALTGTRGAWIGAAALLVIAGCIAAWRITPRRRLIVPTIALAAVCLLGAAGAWLAAGPKIADRLNSGIDEVGSVFREGKYDSDTGMRLAMWRWAAIEFKANPIVGVGAGGYAPWAREAISKGQSTLPPPHDHAHSWLLHTAATLGTVGLLLLGFLVICAILGGLRTPAPDRQCTVNARRQSLGFGPALALIGLVCAGLFDSITINQQTSYMFYLLVALCLPSRPREVDA